MSGFTLSAFDGLVIGGYVLLILGLGLRFSRKTRTTEGYFLAGRSLTWGVIGLSLFASNISSSTLVGLAGSAYATGIAVYNYEWFAVVVLGVFIVFFLPFYLKARVYTMPEFLERRFDARSRVYFAGATVVLSILLELAGGLYAAALVIGLIVPSLALWQTMALLALLAGIYTAIGGLKAVVYTDVIQAILLIFGAGLVALLAFLEVGSWDAVVAQTPEAMLHLVQPLSDPDLPWLGLVTGLPILGLYYWCTNQYIVQRTLGAKTLEHGRKGALLAGLLKIPVLFIMVMPGLFARLLYPDLATPDLVFPTLIFDLLPAGVRGLLLVALIAAIMSSIDSTLNAVSTIITMDFVQKWKPQLDNRMLVKIGRLTTVGVMLLALLWAPQIERFPSLWQYLQAVLAYISPPVLACFIGGIFWKRANGTGAIAALLFGLAVAIGLVWIGTTLHFLYVAALLFGFCLLVLGVVSWFTAPPAAEKTRDLVWSVAIYRAGNSSLARQALVS